MNGDDISRSWDLLTKDQKIKMAESIVDYFATERDETIGVVAANEILDFFQQNIAPAIYNRAIEDARNLVREQAEKSDFELSLLKK